MSEPTENDPSPEANEQGAEDEAQKVDLQALADKVYELLKKEARIERERRGSRRS